MQIKKTARRAFLVLIIVFVCMNVIAAIHAYKFTHFANNSVTKTKDAKQLSLGDKLSALVFGVGNPRPQNKKKPIQKYETLRLQSNKMIECWSIKTDSAKGTVILFHGYAGEKSSMLDKSDEFLRLGYNTLLVDFMGSGGSEGSQTTIGFEEAEEVKSAFDYAALQGEKNIYLFGTSMGAAAVLKSIFDYHISPAGIIIECPYGSLYATTCARFKSMGVPSFPMAGLLDFWGGIENNFWAFSLRPSEYAKAVTCHTLLLYGEKDEKVSREETDCIYANLKGNKMLKTFPLAAHENYLNKYRQGWIENVSEFLK